jgi:hypothetical protein
MSFSESKVEQVPRLSNLLAAQQREVQSDLFFQMTVGCSEFCSLYVFLDGNFVIFLALCMPGIAA